MAGRTGLEPGSNSREQHNLGTISDPAPERMATDSDAKCAIDREPVTIGDDSNATLDVVEVALAEALRGAAAAGEWEVVGQLSRELEARRKARSSVVDLSAERTKRGGR